MTTPQESYDEPTLAEIKAAQDEESAHTEPLKGKMSHKIAAVDKLAKLGDKVVPKPISWYGRSAKGASKFYMGSWADHSADSPKAPFVTTMQSGYAAIVDAKTMSVMKPLVKEAFVLEAAVSPDLKYVLTGGMQNMVNFYDTDEVVENTATKKGNLKDNQRKELEGATHAGYISAISFAQQGKKVFTASGDSMIKEWDFETKSLVKTYVGHYKDVTGICFHPDQPNIFCSSSADKSCRVWDVRTPCAVRKWIAKYSTNCCTMLAGGLGVAVGCDNASWEVFDIGCNMQIGRGKVKKGRCESIATSKSGRFLYMGWDNPAAGYLMMADTYKPDQQKKLDKEAGAKDGPSDMCKSISLDPTGDCLLVSCFDGRIGTYQLPTDAA